MTADRLQQLIQQLKTLPSTRMKSDEHVKNIASRLVKMNNPKRSKIIQLIKPKPFSYNKKRYNAIDFGQDEDILRDIEKQLKKKPKK